MADLAWPRLYCCHKCHNHICCHNDILSESYQTGKGRGFLFLHAMNVVQGPKKDRRLITGLYTVADIHCSDCGEVLGWKYEKANEQHKYKEGKFVIAKFKIVEANWWQQACTWVCGIHIVSLFYILFFIMYKQLNGRSYAFVNISYDDYSIGIIIFNKTKFGLNSQPGFPI